MTTRKLETIKARAERMVRAALRMSAGDTAQRGGAEHYARAVSLLARRCRMSQPHLVARALLLQAGVLAHMGRFGPALASGDEHRME